MSVRLLMDALLCLVVAVPLVPLVVLLLVLLVVMLVMLVVVVMLLLGVTADVAVVAFLRAAAAVCCCAFKLLRGMSCLALPAAVLGAAGLAVLLLLLKAVERLHCCHVVLQGGRRTPPQHQTQLSATHCWRQG